MAEAICGVAKVRASFPEGTEAGEWNWMVNGEKHPTGGETITFPVVIGETYNVTCQRLTASGSSTLGPEAVLNFTYDPVRVDIEVAESISVQFIDDPAPARN